MYLAFDQGYYNISSDINSYNLVLCGLLISPVRKIAALLRCDASVLALDKYWHIIVLPVFWSPKSPVYYTQ